MEDNVVNPVVTSAKFAFEYTNIVSLKPRGIENAAKYIHRKMVTETYKPQTWRTHPLHIIPPSPYDPKHPKTRDTLDFIFLISALNFSFWSENDDCGHRYSVEWKQSWSSPPNSPPRMWTGYWSLVAAIDRAIEARIPILDPSFYSSPTICSDSFIEDIFRPSNNSAEKIPLIQERIAVLREVGSILCSKFGGSYFGLLTEFRRRFVGAGTALQLVQLIVDSFPSFRDESDVAQTRICFWKRAQILVAETWAAFYPEEGSGTLHPFFPGGVSQLTMFADYRVPQILHHIGIMHYPPSLIRLLQTKTLIPPGSMEEVSIRSASILAVELLRDYIRAIQVEHIEDASNPPILNSVLIDFWLWDMAKKLENGTESIRDLETSTVLPAHRTRSIWY